MILHYSDNFDFFVGNHDGFENVGVDYSRQVIYVKDDFWIVKDNFESGEVHEYKQIWQGHYSHEEGADLIRSTMPDASGHDILQLVGTDRVSSSGKRGKHWSIVSKENVKNFSFITVIFPYKGYHNRIDEETKSTKIGKWKIDEKLDESEGVNAICLSGNSEAYLFNLSEYKYQDLLIASQNPIDLFVQKKENEWVIHSLSKSEESISVSTNQESSKLTKSLKPGEAWTLNK